MLYSSGRYFPFESLNTAQIMVQDGTKCGQGRACLNTDCADKVVVANALAAVSVIM